MKFEKPSMQTTFLIGGLVLLWGIHQIRFDPTKLILILSVIFLVFPLTLLGIFANPKIRNSIKKHYWIERSCTLAKIDGLRKRQEKIEDIEEQIGIDQDILSLRETMRGYKDNRFERCIIYALLLFMVTISLTFFDLGTYINISNTIFLIIFFLWGLYYVFDMIKSLFFSFNID